MAKSNSISPDSIIANIKSKKIAPIYFLQGDEPYFIDKISDYIENNVLSEADRGFNQTVLYGKDVDIHAVITAAKRFPMMSDRQVVIIKEAQDIKDLDKTIKNKVAGKEVEYNPLEEYAKKPLSSTLLVFCYKYKTLDARKVLSKTLDEHAIVFTSPVLRDYEMPAWIEKTVKEKGHDISDKAVTMLLDFVGANLSRINNEIDKILVNFKEKIAIDDTHVLKFVGISKEYNSLELQKALGKKDALKSNKIINYFADNKKDNPIQPVLSSLFNYFTKLMVIHCSGKKSTEEIKQVLGLHPKMPDFVIKEDFLTPCHHYNLSKTLAIFGYIRQADMQSKGFENGSMDDAQIMKELIYKILH